MLQSIGFCVDWLRFMAQCAAKTKDGKPCQIPALQGKKYCHIHRKQKLWYLAFSSVTVGALLLGVLAFLADVTGVLGYLGFYWPSSRDSQKATDQVVVLSSGYRGATNSKNIYSVLDFSCFQQTRLSNQGSANASIVKYQATIYFKGKTATVAGDQAYSELEISNELTDYDITHARVQFVDRNGVETNTKEPLFPIQIVPFSTADVFTKVSFMVMNYLTIDDFDFPTWDPYMITPPGLATPRFSPLDVSFTFTTASGKTIAATPRAFCLYMK